MGAQESGYWSHGSAEVPPRLNHESQQDGRDDHHPFHDDAKPGDLSRRAAHPAGQPSVTILVSQAPDRQHPALTNLTLDSVATFLGLR